jgi:hypothetical protein
VELLKAGNAGKMVKQLSKSEHSGELKKIAVSLVEEWKSVIKKSTPSNPTKLKGEKRSKYCNSCKLIQKAVVSNLSSVSSLTKNVPEEPVEKKARPDKLFKLGSKEASVSGSKPKGIMIRILNFCLELILLFVNLSYKQIIESVLQ